MTDKNETPASEPGEWAIVEVMGHRQHAGRISEVTRFGAVLLRCDQPVGDGFATVLIGGASIYALTIVTEARARATAARMADPRPMEPAGFRPRLALEHTETREGGVDDGSI